MRTPAILGDLSDLVLGRGCQVCQAIGPELCEGCLESVRTPARAVPMPPGMPPAMAAAAYFGTVQRLVLAYKQDGHRSLARPLGTLLADAVEALLMSRSADSCTLVPVPTHRRPQRGFDALAPLVRQAAHDLRTRGLPVEVGPWLLARGDYAPAKSLGRRERQLRLAGAFAARVPPSGVRRRQRSTGPIVVVDDVLTTGATVTEAIRALTEASIGVNGIAVVASVSRPQRQACAPPG